MGVSQQCTHSARSCILKRKTFHQQKHLLDVTKQLSLICLVSFSSRVTQKYFLQTVCQIVRDLAEFRNESNKCEV